MGILARAFSSKSTSQDVLRALMLGNQSSSGKNVNLTSAIQVSTVFAVCRVVGEGVAQVPLKLMKYDGKTRLPYTEHPLYNILSTKPNDWQTSFEYREMMIWHLMLTGNHFSFINRARGKILELIPFSPGQVSVDRKSDYTLIYKVRTDDGKVMEFPAESIWHVKGPSLNGWLGLDPVKLARDAIGLAMASEESAGRLQKNGVRPSGVYSVEGTLKDDAYKALSNWIHENITGSENAGKPLILDRAAKWTNTQMSGVDAQSLETRKFQIEEICRFARVMPIMVGYSDKASTYASSEQMFLAHVVHTLAPWYQRIEQSIDANLLTEAERNDGVYSNFVEEGLLRGSTADTKDAILGYVNGGIMTPNEGRAKLDMNPMDDGESDELRIPANIVGAIPETNDAPESDPKTEENQKAIESLQIELKHMTALAQRAQPINVDARTTVTMPDIKQGSIEVNIPEIKSSDVNIQVDAPITHVSAAPPVITVNPSDVVVKAGDVLVQPAEVQVHLPARKSESNVERDAKGNIIRTTSFERDV
jgi:HK97 family phage portal protein